MVFFVSSDSWIAHTKHFEEAAEEQSERDSKAFEALSSALVIQ